MHPATWQQAYSLFGQGLCVSALLAALPIFTLLFLLGVLRKPAWVAGIASLAVAFALAIAGYGMPVKAAVSAAAYGGAFGLFPISWIIFWAIALFRVTVETGKFEIIRDSIGRLTADPRLQALLIAFSFGAFLEGAAGFGTPVAIAATMLTGLGFSPFSASAICLLANTVPVAFGSIGIPVITLAGTTGLPLDKLSRAVGLMCSPVALIIPAYLIVAMCGFGAMSGVWLPALASGAAFATVQLLVSSFMGPQLSSLLAAISSMAVLILILRLRTRRTRGVESMEDAAFAPTPGADLRMVGMHGSPASGKAPSFQLASHPGSGQVLYAWSPYALLLACMMLCGLAPVPKLLTKGPLVFAWPALHDVVERMPPVAFAPSPYHAIYSLNFLSASGTACMAATLLAAICL